MLSQYLSHKLVHSQGAVTALFYDDPLLVGLQQKIQYTFKSPKLLLEALTHKSFAHEKDLPNNEVLEFLGDAVVDLIVTSKLIKLFPDQEEGHLSKLRSAIVNKETLAEVAVSIELETVILVGRGELQNNGHQRDSNLSNALEALIGAIFKEAGYDKTCEVVEGLFEKGSRNYFDFTILDQVDVKGQLQELVYKKYQSTPTYKCFEVKENKKVTFNVSVEVEGKVLSEGNFPSKKKGMQIVAKEALNKIKQGDI